MSDPNDTQTTPADASDATSEAPQPGVDFPVEGTAIEAEPLPLNGDKPADPSKPKGSSLQDLVDEPAKVMRIGTMIRQLLEEVKAAPLDDAARGRLAEIHERSIKELEDGLAPELVEELDRISLPFPDDATPSDAELRIAQAQLVGWLEGLFHGIQTALFAQQMAARQQLEQMRRGLPPGTAPQPGPENPLGRGTGQYL